MAKSKYNNLHEIIYATCGHYVATFPVKDQDTDTVETQVFLVKCVSPG
jgi:hypothetical protein